MANDNDCLFAEIKPAKMNSFPHFGFKNGSKTRLSPHFAGVIFGPARKWVKQVSSDSFFAREWGKNQSNSRFQKIFSE
jgi:hypothetical protein